LNVGVYLAKVKPNSISYVLLIFLLRKDLIANSISNKKKSPMLFIENSMDNNDMYLEV